MKADEPSFGQLIHRLRIEKKFTVKDLIAQLENKGEQVSPSYITRIEVHGEIASPKLTYLLADVLDYDADKLMDIAIQEKTAQNKQRLVRKYETTFALFKKAKKT